MNNISERAIKERIKNGVTGDKVYAPKRPGNYLIDAAKALKIWQDIQLFVKKYPAKTIDITGMVARHNGVSKSLVMNIRHGRSWNSVTGLLKKDYGND